MFPCASTERSRREESFEAAAEAADVGAHLAGGSAACEVSCVDAVYAHRDEVVPVGGMTAVGLTQVAEPVQGVTRFDLVDDVVGC